MKYHDGSELHLGDIVRTPIGKDVTTRGRVVMVGDTFDHLEVDPDFISWVKTAEKLGSNQVVIEFMDKNPFEHEDPKFAPVGDYMFTAVDERLTFESRPRCAAAIDLPNSLPRSFSGYCISHVFRAVHRRARDGANMKLSPVL